MKKLIILILLFAGYNVGLVKRNKPFQLNGECFVLKYKAISPQKVKCMQGMKNQNFVILAGVENAK